MNIAPTDTKPWYKQFWPWFVFAIPACAVVMGISLVYVASQNKVSIVKEDWYKDGLAINQRIDKQLKARELGLTAQINFDREAGALTVMIPQIKSTQTSTIQINLVHPTLAEGDETVELTRTPTGDYWAKLNSDKAGFFYLQINDADQEWQLDGAINFNNQQVSVSLSAE